MNIDSKGIMQSDEHKTTIKTRVIGNNHQLLRVDDETPFNLSGLRQKEFIHHCLELIRNEKPHVIIFEDYDKGVITPEVIASVTGEAQKLNIPVTVDPKRKNFNHYSNITLFKPNLHELNTGLGIIIEKPDHEVLRDVLSQMISERNMKMIMVTLSEAGVFVTDGDNDALIPAHVRSISDVSGAGDTVISVASLCLAAGTNARTMAALANLAGGLVCEEVGVVPVNRERLIAEAKNDPGIQL
jgi:D-glycero-beta-D-manno-heptose-7-phosphate kinase